MVILVRNTETAKGRDGPAVVWLRGAAQRGFGIRSRARTPASCGATGGGNKHEAAHHWAAFLALRSSHWQAEIGLNRPIPYCPNVLFSVEGQGRRGRSRTLSHRQPHNRGVQGL